MGKIYEDMKLHNAEIDDDENYTDDNDYISVTNFIEILELYSQDARDMVLNFLITDVKFLELDIYEIEPKTNKAGEKTLFQKYRYSSEEPLNEIWLEDIASGGRFSDYDSYYWRIDSILALESMQRIGLTQNSLDECQDAMFIDPNLALEYKKENIELKELLKITLNDETGNSTSLIIKQLYVRLHQLENTIKTELKPKSNINDEDLNPKSAKAVTRLLNVLFHKANYDISNAHSGTINTKIVEYSKTLNTKIDKKTVARWIKEVQQLRIDSEK